MNINQLIEQLTKTRKDNKVVVVNQEGYKDLTKDLTKPTKDLQDSAPVTTLMGVPIKTETSYTSFPLIGIMDAAEYEIAKQIHTTIKKQLDNQDILSFWEIKEYLQKGGD